MRLILKQNDRIINEFQFVAGPIYIGRQENSQIFLHDRAVSRHHTVLFNTQDNKWIVEDLDSTNKTLLNDKEIHKAEIKSGDVIRIATFTIEVALDDNAAVAKPISPGDTQAATPHGLDDTQTVVSHDAEIIVRRLDIETGTDMKMPAKRAKDFLHATEGICKANGPDDLLNVLLGIVAKQFTSFHVWCALRVQASGPMTSHAGKTRDGKMVQLSQLKLQDKIGDAIESGHFYLFPKVPTKLGEERIQSVMIAPLVGLAGCLGVIYVDNAMDHARYSLSDLDYLTMLAIHTAAIVENF